MLVYYANCPLHATVVNRSQCKLTFKTRASYCFSQIFHGQKRTSDKPEINKIVHKLLANCVRIACFELLDQVRNKLLTTCNTPYGAIRLVTRLFQQG